MANDRPDYERQRRQVRFVSAAILVVLISTLGDHLYRVVERPSVKDLIVTPATTTTTMRPIQSFTAYEANQYMHQCGKISPSAIDLEYWYATEYSCAPSWLHRLTTVAQMEDQWYGHACKNFHPTKSQILAFNNTSYHCPGDLTYFLPTYES